MTRRQFASLKVYIWRPTIPLTLVWCHLLRLQQFAGRQFRHLVHAVCPSIYGQELVKVSSCLSYCFLVFKRVLDDLIFPSEGQTPLSRAFKSAFSAATADGHTAGAAGACAGAAKAWGLFLAQPDAPCPVLSQAGILLVCVCVGGGGGGGAHGSGTQKENH